MNFFMRSRICVLPLLAWMSCVSCRQADENGGAASEVQPAAPLDRDATQIQNEEPLPSLDELLAAAGVKLPHSREVVIVVGVLNGGEVWARPAGGGLCRHWFDGEIDVEKNLYGSLRKPLDVSLDLWNPRTDTVPLQKQCIFVIELPTWDDALLSEHDFLAVYLIEEHRFARAMEMPGESGGG
jgi:hypothetical protein